MNIHDLLDYFTVERLKKHLYAFKLVVLAGCAYGFASYTAMEVIAPFFEIKKDDAARVRSRAVKIGKTRARNYYEIILDRNLFDSTDKPVPGTTSTSVVSGGDDITGPSVKSNLPLQLVGTMVLNNPSWSLALITGDSNSKSNSYMKNDIILSSAVIVRIVRNKVYLRNNGRLEYIEVQGEEPAFVAEKGSGDVSIADSGEGKFTVNKRELNSAFQDLSKILTQARVVPHFKDGKTVGFRIFAIQPNSIYQKLGLKNNDIIARVNGVLIDDPTKGLQLFNALKTESNIKLDIEREGAKQSFSYDIK
jgi:general secretion pathway protein C